MKAVLAIEHGQILPTIGLINPNPNIDFDGARVKVVTETTPVSYIFRLSDLALNVNPDLRVVALGQFPRHVRSLDSSLRYIC